MPAVIESPIGMIRRVLDESAKVLVAGEHTTARAKPNAKNLSILLVGRGPITPFSSTHATVAPLERASDVAILAVIT